MFDNCQYTVKTKYIIIYKYIIFFYDNLEMHLKDFLIQQRENKGLEDTNCARKALLNDKLDCERW